MQALHVSSSLDIATSSIPVLTHRDSENDKWKTWTNYSGCNTRIREHLIEDHYERYTSEIEANDLKRYAPSSLRKAIMKTSGGPTSTEPFTRDGAVRRLRQCVDLDPNVRDRALSI